MFEKVIQEVCDASQVDFEESGVDQKTLLDLREVSDNFWWALWCLLMAYDVVVLESAKSGGARSAGGKRCLWGLRRLMRLSLYAPAATRFWA